MKVREIMSLPIATIGEGERLGLIDSAAVVSLKARFAAEGQIVPILVKRNGDQDPTEWTLIAGRHRLLAARELGWMHIDAIQSAGEHDGREVVERIETAENLDRRVLRPIERAILLAARVEGHQQHREIVTVTKSEEPTDNDGFFYQENSIDSDVVTMTIASAELMAASAARCGCSVRTLYRDLAIYMAIVRQFPDLYRPLNDHRLGASFDAMRKLARVKLHKLRRDIIETVIADPDMPSIDEAMVRLKVSTSKGKRPNADDHEARILRGFERLRLTDKRAVAVGIVNALPKSLGPELVEIMRARGFLD